MATEHRIVGPPGTGKTDLLRRQVEKWDESGEYAPEDVVLTSFTRAAAKVLAGRIAVPDQNIATLHALAYRQIGQPPIAEVGELAVEWNESGVPASWKIGKAAPSLDEGLAIEVGEGEMLQNYSLARSRLLDRNHPLMVQTALFATAWEQFKYDAGAVDFTDMIIRSLYLYDAAPPGAPAVLVVDEGQDLVPLQWALVRHWAQGVEEFLVAGDPAQTIYHFAGARPDEMLSPLPEGHIRGLSQSHRMSRAVMQQAEGVLKLHSSGIDAHRDYAARDADGALRHLPATWRYPDPVVAELSQLGDNEEAMVLASCTYMLGPLTAQLRERGIPFHNPYRPQQGQWNPLPRGGDTGTAAKVKAFLDGKLTDWPELLDAKIYHTRGGKKHVAAEPETLRDWLLPESLRAFEARDLGWLAAHAMKGVESPLAYAVSLGKRDLLGVDPSTIVGTVHSVKGGEAGDPRRGAEYGRVYLFPDLSSAGHHEMTSGQEGYDAAVRLAYVALSRARDEIVLCEPASSRVMPL